MNSVQQAFDRHAPAYDEALAGCKIRDEVWETADRCFAPGMSVLDLGCGTGEDAIHLSRRGVNITAIDISSGMIARLKSKRAEGIVCRQADMRTYAPLDIKFDGAFSNFGALNCVPSLEWLANIPFSPGSHLVLNTIGRFYPLESAVFLLKGQPRLAFRRIGRRRQAVVENVRFNVYYHSLRALRRWLEPRFDLIQVKGLRSIVPSVNLAHLDKFSLFHILEPLDRWLCSHRLTAPYADHFISVWKYREG